MAHSRLEKIGSIYSRITGLIRSGSMKLEDRPLWYEVYQAFPPKYPPRFDRPIPEGQIKSIFYPEDVIRAKFYKNVRNIYSVNLSDNHRQSLCQKCISLCTELQKENNLELDEAFNKALHTILVETEAKFVSKNEPKKHLRSTGINSNENEVQKMFEDEVKKK